jgi:hypothetical protein
MFIADGILTLSGFEIVADIGEIQTKSSKSQELNRQGSDSDSGTESDDPLDSFYPVQPRYKPYCPGAEADRKKSQLIKNRTNRIMKRDFQDYVTDLFEMDIEESAIFLRDASSSNKDLKAAEALRESLEIVTKVGY